MLLFRVRGDTVVYMWFGHFRIIYLVYFLWVGVLLLAIVPPPAHGADKRVGTLSVTLDGGMVPHVNSWATLRLTLPHLTGGMTAVTVQDVRGGVVIRRHLQIFRRHILMPIPYVSGAGGLGAPWPVVVRIHQAGGIWRVLNSQVDLPLIRSTPATTIAVWRHGDLDVSVVAKALGMPLQPLIFSRRQLASSPVLNFAACRWLLMDRAITPLLSRQRVLALLSLGVRLVDISSRPPGILPASAWHNSGIYTSGVTVWTTRSFDGFKYGVPVVVPQLSRLRITPLLSPAVWQYAAWAIGPLTLLMLMLLRGAGLRQWKFIFSIALGVLLLSAATLFWLSETTGVRTIRYRWQTCFAPGPLRLYNTITMARCLHPVNQSVEGAADNLTLPLAWSPRAWFAFHGCIKLHRDSAVLAYPVARQPTILAYHPRVVLSRNLPHYVWPKSFVSAASLPGGFSYQAGVLFTRGQIYSVIHPYRGHDFYNWLRRGYPAAQLALRFWLWLQFNVHRRYYVSLGHSRAQIIALPPSVSRIGSLSARKYTQR